MEHADLYYKLGAVVAVTLALFYARLPERFGKEVQEKGPIIGIDVGSAYMSAGIWKDDGVSIIYNSYGRQTTPSVITFHDSGRIYVGDMANTKTASGDYSTFYHIYAVLGRAWGDPKVQDIATSKFAGFTLVNRKGKPAFLVNDTTMFYPEEMLAVFLAYMKDEAEDVLLEEVKKAVLTVPAYFNDHQRRAVKNAGRLAGLDVIKTLNAPTAIAVYHSLTLPTKGKHTHEKDDTIVMVVDFGASHFDVSILLIAEGVVEAIASTGTDTISGEKINRNVANYFIKQYKRKHGAEVEHGFKAMALLLKEVERVKRQLSYHEVATLDIEMFHGYNDFTSSLSRDGFEDLNKKIWDEIDTIVRKALYESKNRMSDIDEIILTGGSSRIPRVRQLLQKIFPQKISILVRDPDLLATYGAALQGGMMSHKSSLRDKLTLDISTSSLGYKTSHGNISVVIPKCTALPSHKTFNFTTAEHNQESMVVSIYEGVDTPDEAKWGDLVIDGVAPSRKEFPMFEVTLKVDIRGLYNFTMNNKSVAYDAFVIKPAVRGLKSLEIPGLVANVSRVIAGIRSTHKREKYVLNAEMRMYLLKWKVSHEFEDSDKTKKKKKFEELLASFEVWFDDIEERSLSEIVVKLLDMDKELEELEMPIS